MTSNTFNNTATQKKKLQSGEIHTTTYTSEGTTSPFGRRKTSVWYTAGGAQNVPGPRQTRKRTHRGKRKTEQDLVTIFILKKIILYGSKRIFTRTFYIIFHGLRCQLAHIADHSRSSSKIRRVKNTVPKILWRVPSLIQRPATQISTGIHTVVESNA